MKPVILLAIVAALVSGICSALQGPTNALLARGASSAVNAALISFAVGTIALLAVALALGDRPNLPAMRELPPYVWLGGLYGAFFVFAGAFAVPRIGVAYFAVLLLAGQLAMALLLDHLGALGLDRVPINASRLVGVAVILGGVLLVRR